MRDIQDVATTPSKERVLFDNTRQWFYDREIDNLESQLLKLHEEATELWQATCRNVDSKEIQMELGDIFVVAIGLAKILGIDPLESLEMAYSKIKNRTGKTVKGNFVKELK